MSVRIILSGITGIESFKELDPRILNIIFESAPTYETFYSQDFVHLPSVVVTHEQEYSKNADYDEEKVFWIFGPAKHHPKPNTQKGRDSYVFGFFLIKKNVETKVHTVIRSEFFTPTKKQCTKWRDEVIVPYVAEELSKLTPIPLG